MTLPPAPLADKKILFQGMLNIYYILYEKSRLFLAGGRSTPPPLADMFAEMSIFFYALPKRPP